MSDINERNADERFSSVPDLTAQQVIDKLTAEFGPGFSNGVHAILLHEALPEHFGKKDWEGWFFKPADAAFAWAHDAGLIVPWKLTRKWQFTPFGREVAALAFAQARDL